MSEERFVTRGFVGMRRGGEKKERIPPGQYLTNDFPVLSARPTFETIQTLQNRQPCFLGYFFSNGCILRLAPGFLG